MQQTGPVLFPFCFPAAFVIHEVDHLRFKRIVVVGVGQNFRNGFFDSELPGYDHPQNQMIRWCRYGRAHMRVRGTINILHVEHDAYFDGFSLFKLSVEQDVIFLIDSAPYCRCINKILIYGIDADVAPARPAKPVMEPVKIVDKSLSFMYFLNFMLVLLKYSYVYSLCSTLY